MIIETHGRFFIQRRTIPHSDENNVAIFEVGERSEIREKRYDHVSSDRAFSTLSEAREWIAAQGE